MLSSIVVLFSVVGLVNVGVLSSMLCFAVISTVVDVLVGHCCNVFSYLLSLLMFNGCFSRQRSEIILVVVVVKSVFNVVVVGGMWI